MSLPKILTSRWGPVITGLAVGILGPILVWKGNPGNMGVCVACFSRDIAGALGLHRVPLVQYIRPEIIVAQLWQDGRKIIDARGQTLPLPIAIYNSLEIGRLFL